MATPKLFTLKSYFNFMDEPFTADLVLRTTKKVCWFLWVLVCDFVLYLYGLIIKHLARSRIVDDHENSLDTAVVFNEQQKPILPTPSGSNFNGFDEEEKSEFTFGFRFQMKEEDFVEAKSGTTGDAFMDTGLTTMTSTSKYQFVPVQDFSEFVATPESASFTIHESFVDDGADFIIKEKGISEQNLSDLEVEQEANIRVEQELNEKVDDFKETEVSSSQILQSTDLPNTDSINSEEKTKISVTDSTDCDKVEELQMKNRKSLGEDRVLEPEQVNWLGDFFMRNDSFSYGVQFSQEHEADSVDSHLESDDSKNGFFSVSPQDVEIVTEKESESLIPEIDDDFTEFEPNLKDHESKLGNLDSSGELELELELDSCTKMMESVNELMKGIKIVEECNVKSWGELDLDEEDDADVLLEHQELIGQMKMELKNARTGGLPTILEESETPRMKEDYKPLKINEKLEHRDLMAEIQKFYKSYTEKMRKLDVLNYQTLQAINFLRMKHPDQINTEENTSLSALKSVLLPSLWPCKLRKIYADPTLKSVTELHKDLEIVYVGQACLSWEILHWQYKKQKNYNCMILKGTDLITKLPLSFNNFMCFLEGLLKMKCFKGHEFLITPNKDVNLKDFFKFRPLKVNF